jgi:regulator of protease activity HflC (stomatin/prohibitin superfamily)
MNDKSEVAGEIAEGRNLDSYLVQSQEGQDMRISLNLRWRLDPTKLVSIHKTVRQNVEEKIIRPVVMRVVKDKATEMKAIDAYSGTGLVQLQREIQDALTGKDQEETDELAQRGITVENFVIEHIELDPKYIEEIKQKQIATQKQLRAVEEEKAATAEALVAKAKAQADLNTQVVAAERDAKVMVVGAQAENEKVIIAAKAAAEQVTIAAQAEKEKLVLEANGKKEAQIALAEGVLAMGKAEAEAKRVLFAAWNTPGIDNYVTVQVAGPEGLSGAFKNIQGYIPESMKINVLSTSFLESLKSVVGSWQPKSE